MAKGGITLFDNYMARPIKWKQEVCHECKGTGKDTIVTEEGNPQEILCLNCQGTGYVFIKK